MTAARRRGISLGEFVREAVRLSLERIRPSEAVRDSFLDDDRVYSGPAPADASVRHDEYLYGEEP